MRTYRIARRSRSCCLCWVDVALNASLGIPLFLGFDELEAPRTLAHMLETSRRVAATSASPTLAKTVIRAAFRAMEDAPASWTFSVSDASVHGHGPDSDADAAQQTLQKLSATLTSVVRLFPSVWKRNLIEAWRGVSGALVESDELNAIFVRKGRRAVADVTVRGSEVATRIRVAARGALLDEDARAVLPPLASACVEDGDLVVVRPGLVADARTLSTLVDASFTLAERLEGGAPYR